MYEYIYVIPEIFWGVLGGKITKNWARRKFLRLKMGGIFWSKFDIFRFFDDFWKNFSMFVP